MLDLRLGDCLEILPTLADKSVDAIITDLPYGTTACSWDEVIPFEPMWAQVKRICKGVFVTTASQPFTSRLIVSNLEWFRYSMEWIKPKGTDVFNSNKKPLNAHEDICLFSSNGHTYNPQLRTGAPYTRKQGKHSSTMGVDLKGITTVNNGDRKPLTWIEIPNITGSNVHPTQKPVALYDYLIRTYTNAGDTVLDFTMGSGTTGVACVQLGRNFIGIEKEEKYYTIAQRRIAEAQKQMVMEL